MTVYAKTAWQDRIVERAKTFTVTENADGTITLTPAPGAVIQEGTAVNASQMNRLEQGILDAYWQSGATPLEGATTTLTRVGGLLTRVDETVEGVLRRRTELSRTNGQLTTVTMTIYASDGVTVERQWTDTLVRTGGVLTSVERTVQV